MENFEQGRKFSTSKSLHVFCKYNVAFIALKSVIRVFLNLLLLKPLHCNVNCNLFCSVIK